MRRVDAVLLLAVSAATLPVRTSHAQTACSPALLLDNASPARGDFSIDLRSGYSLIPSRVVAGLRITPALAIRWAPTDRLVLTLDAQTVDNSGPGRQGKYLASRTLRAAGAGSGNFFQEQALGARWRAGNSCSTGSGIALGGSLSRGVRSYVLRDTAAGRVAEGDNQAELIPTLDASVEWRRPHWHSALGVMLAFFPADNALYLRRMPEAQGDAFGITAGLSIDAAVLMESAALRGRLFAPFSGANTIRRATGRTARWPVYNVAVGYAVNPMLATEVFLSNALSSYSALSLVADREYAAMGGGVRYMSGGRRISRGKAMPSDRLPIASGASASLLDPSFSHALRVSVGAGSGGTYVSLGGSPVPDLVLVASLDYVSNTLDEGDLGALAAVRFVRQSPQTPISLGVLLAASRSNNVLVNLLAGRADEFARRGLEKSGFRFGDESVTDGKLYLLTGAVPVRRDFANGGHVWGAPTVAAVQRRGIELAGVVGGITWPLVATLHATLETGVPLDSEGNALERTSRVRRLPWGTSIAWSFPSSPFTLDLYATNRVGSSPFHALRVRANGGIDLGVGLSVAAAAR